MPKNSYLTIAEKERILKLYKEDKSFRQIGREINRSHNVVRNFIKAPFHYGTNILHAGRKHKLSQREERNVKKNVGVKKMSLREAANNFPGDISASTICRIIKNSPYSFSKLNVSPKLNTKQKEKRIKFSKNMLLKGEDYFKSIVFSDEKRFTIYGPDGFRGYWRDLRKEPEYFFKQKYSPGIMVWAAISIDGQVSISFVEGSITSAKYQDILSQNLLPNFSKDLQLFQQDNATPHVSKSTKEWLFDKEINTIEWPPNSPDLNLIENIWGLLVRKIYRKTMTFSDIEELKNEIMKEWKKLPKIVFQNLYKSLAERFFDVIRLKGCTVN